ncbi:GyrI-like domain-containing protein [Sporosarcina contaminans]|uniref:GyrI-like domain-containing protein n=1 Tax=Sporosarcina contaminans TaxID=633403 RepID=A0ABW3TXI7_9BACL
MLSIGKTAYLVGLTTKAIKHYEEIGLVRPAYVSPESGYRFYSQKEQQQLIRIRTLRNFGVSLSDILLEGDEQMESLLLKRKKEIADEIEELNGKMEGIDQLLNEGEKKMETRIVESEGFTVKGYEVKGPVSAIPAEWDRLNKVIHEEEVIAEESFGVCLSMENEMIHYIAGLKEDLTGSFPDTKEVTIPAGKFIVAKVEGGIPGIPATYDAIIQMEDIQLRDCFDFERYVHPVGATEDIIEIWMPIE